MHTNGKNGSPSNRNANAQGNKAPAANVGPEIRKGPQAAGNGPQASAPAPDAPKAPPAPQNAQAAPQGAQDAPSQVAPETPKAPEAPKTADPLAGYDVSKIPPATLKIARRMLTSGDAEQIADARAMLEEFRSATDHTGPLLKVGGKGTINFRRVPGLPGKLGLALYPEALAWIFGNKERIESFMRDNAARLSWKSEEVAAVYGVTAEAFKVQAAEWKAKRDAAKEAEGEESNEDGGQDGAEQNPAAPEAPATAAAPAA